MNPNVIAVDVGNSVAKLTILTKDSTWIHRATYFTDNLWADRLIQWVLDHEKRPLQWRIASVNQTAADQLCASARFDCWHAVRG